MTVQVVLAWTVVRSLVVATIALPASSLMARGFRQATWPAKRKRLLTLLAIAPLFVPNLLTGFTYRMTAARLVHSKLGTECLYGLLLLASVVSLQFVIREILPTTPYTPESLHSWRLLKQSHLQPYDSDRINIKSAFRWWSEWGRMQILGPHRSSTICWISGALFCFQEFETAALLQIDRHPIAFTVWLFDAHALNEPLSHSLQFVVRSLLMQSGLLLPALFLITNKSVRPYSQAHLLNVTAGSRGAISRPLIAIAICCVSIGLVLVWPSASHLTDAVRGLKSLVLQGSLPGRGQQILGSTAVAATAAVLAMNIAARLRGGRHRWLILAAVVPGLCGSLVLSLGLLALFQQSALRPAYDTYVPMVTAQTLLMLPRAVVLHFVLEITAGPSSRHTAQLLTGGTPRQTRAAGNLLWHLARRRHLLAVAVLTHWSFWDVTTAAMLRPVHFEPIVARLYNEMHWGRTETLTAITALALLIPLIVFGLTAFAWKRISVWKPG